MDAESDERIEVESWGMLHRSRCRLVAPGRSEEIPAVFDLARRQGLPVGLRGAGRSYGDAALSDDGILLDLSRLDRILDWDPASGLLRAEPGVTLRQCWQRVLPEGWWPPVVSGTMHVTLGGAAAMNIHGKNAFRVGPIGDHVVAFELLLPDGTRRRCSREENADLFFAAIGGFGMLGVFTELTLRMKRIHSGLLEVEPHAVESFEQGLDLFHALEEGADYLVGWHDALVPDRGLGRGLIHRARHLRPEEDEDPSGTLSLSRHRLPRRFFGVVPRSWLWLGLRLFLNRPGMRLLNSLKYRGGRMHAGRGSYRQEHALYHFLLDYVPGWQKAYRPGGLLQFQPFVPRERAAGVFRSVVEGMRRAGHPPFLCVTKRHRPDPFLMTHGLDGFSLALDLKVTAGNRRRVWEMTEALEDLVIDAGGRFYFAKDAVLRPRNLRRAWPAETVERFLALKDRCDPQGLLATDLSRRLGLSPAAL